MNRPYWLVVIAMMLVPHFVIQHAVSAEKSLVLKSDRKAGSVDRVTVALEASGERSGSLDRSEIGKKGELERKPVTVQCHLEYLEKTLSVPAGKETAWKSIRHYDRAEANLQVGKENLDPTLRGERAFVVAIADPPKVELFSPQGPLSINELDLISMMGNTLLLDALLPEGEVAMGQSWKLSDDVVTALLDIDSVMSHTVECSVTEITPTVVRFKIAGKAVGRKDDASIENIVEGRYRFDLRLNRIDWLGLGSKVHQDIGATNAGFDLVVKLQVRAIPEHDDQVLADSVTKSFEVQPLEGLLDLEYSSGGDWTLAYPRSWSIVRYHQEICELRLVLGGEFVAQCAISPMPKRKPDRLPSLSEFQADVERALGKSYRDLAEAGESTSSADYRVMRVIVDGELGDAPRQWRYYHVSDSTGRAVVFAFNVEAKLAEKLAGEDTMLIEGFRFAAEAAAQSP